MNDLPKERCHFFDVYRLKLNEVSLHFGRVLLQIHSVTKLETIDVLLITCKAAVVGDETGHMNCLPCAL